MCAGKKNLQREITKWEEQVLREEGNEGVMEDTEEESGKGD